MFGGLEPRWRTSSGEWSNVRRAALCFALDRGPYLPLSAMRQRQALCRVLKGRAQMQRMWARLHGRGLSGWPSRVYRANCGRHRHVWSLVGGTEFPAAILGAYRNLAATDLGSVPWYASPIQGHDDCFAVLSSGGRRPDGELGVGKGRPSETSVPALAMADGRGTFGSGEPNNSWDMAVAPL